MASIPAQYSVTALLGIGSIEAGDCMAEVTLDAACSGGIAVHGTADENTPIVLVRGLRIRSAAGSGQDLVRSLDEDLFR